MSNTWLKGKQRNPWERPHIDWWESWKPFIPFWLTVLAITFIWWIIFGG